VKLNKELRINKMKETIDDRRYRMQMEERQGKMSGGMMQYNEGGSMLNRYDDGGPVKSHDDKKLKAFEKERDAILNKLYGSDNKENNITEKERKELKEEYTQLSKDFSKDFFDHQRIVDNNTKRKNKAEGGSMLVPPEMGLEDDVPVDTYDNIPEDEKEAAEASQLPDDEMEEDYTDYVLEQSLDVEEQEYLMGVLENDERLSGIFDKVMDVAGEFSGEGEVEGLGTGVSDSIPARLSDGEFVFTKKATDQLGADQLQTMMDDAEKAYDGGLMKKAFGGMVDDSVDESRMGMYSDEEEEIKKQMIDANRMPSVR
jgi:hypothetical protein